MLAAQIVGHLIVFASLVVGLAVEVAVLLKALFLRHAAALLGRLDVAATGPEAVHGAVEELVFSKLAVDRAVHQRHLETGAQAHLVEELFLARDHPGIVSREGMLQALAQGAIHGVEVGRRQALAIGRVGNHDGRRGGLGELAYVLLLQNDTIGHAGAFGVSRGSLDGRQVQVVAIYLVVEGALLRVVVVDAVEQIAVEVLPPLKAEALAKHARIDVSGHESGLDEDGARAAEGVDEVFLEVPPRELHESGRQHLVDGRLDGGHAVAAQVEAVARGVERERAAGFGHVYVETDVGVGDADVGALALRLAEIVDDGVLHLIGHELGVAELLRVDHGVDGERGFQVEIAAPIDRLHGLIDVVGIFRLEVLDGFQDAHGRAQTEVGPVHHLAVAAERHHAAANLYIVGTQLRQLLRQDFFQALKGLGDEFKFFFHLYF